MNKISGRVKSKRRREVLENLSNLLIVITSLVLILAITAQALGTFPWFTKQLFLTIQLVVSIIFMIDFWVNFAYANQRWLYFMRKFIFFLVSIPYLNLVHWFDPGLPHLLYNYLSLVPLIRVGYGMVIIVRWFVRNQVASLMLSYVILVILYSYVSALVFYLIERNINPDLHSFADALFWSGMNVTTVGASFFAVTNLGKILSVTLPALGMMMFPIFTLYVTDKFQRIKNKYKKSDRNQPKN